MAEEFNAKCDICGKPYKVCHTCQEIKSYKPWRTVTCSLPHYLIYFTLAEYTKTHDKEKAKLELENCDLSDLESFNENVKETIKEIMKTGNKEATTLPKKIEKKVKVTKKSEDDENDIE